MTTVGTSFARNTPSRSKGAEGMLKVMAHHHKLRVQSPVVTNRRTQGEEIAAPSRCA